MTSKWIVEEGKDRLDLGDGEWIDIKKKLSIQDRDDMMSGMVEYESAEEGLNRQERRALQRKMRSGEAGAPMKPKLKASTLALLTVAVVGWNLKGSDGQVLELTPENLGKLDPILADHIEDEVDTRNPLGKVHGPRTITKH